MHPLATLAKSAVEGFLIERNTIAPPKSIPQEYLKKMSGVFVTIKKDGELRGCIGTYAPTQENIAQEVIHNAIDAAVNDPRFDPIGPDELTKLSYEIYILDKPETVAWMNNLDPKVYGVIVCSAKGRKSGLLLPGLDGIDTIEQQLAVACQKAGINPNTEKISVFRFRAEKFS